MKRRILNGCLIVTSLLGYLEWGTENHMFLFQGEGEVLSRLVNDPLSVAHPLTLMPLFGQIILFITLFQKRPSKIMTFIGLACLGVLLFFISFVGVISLNYKIFLSTLPFVITAILTVKENLKK
ncbi:MAG: hypothetical protein IPL32_09130 [Chloracidobacterium sp.]|nr:hypothetical protein [Chloracidobacterium sp.]